MGDLTLPLYGVTADLFGTGVLKDAIEIGDIGAYKPMYAGLTAYFHWDINTMDQQALVDLVNSVGGTLPLAGPIAGTQVLNFQQLAAAGSSTGLDLSAAGAPSITYYVVDGIVGTDPNGLVEFNDDGKVEVTSLIATDGGSLGGTHFTFSSTLTDFYVWYNVPSTPGEATLEFSAIPDNGHSLLIADPAADYHVYFVNSGWHQVTEVTTTDGSGIVGGEYFTFSANGNDYFVWFNSGADAAPVVAGVGIEVAYTASDTADEVGDAIITALEGIFDVTTSGSGSTFNIIDVSVQTQTAADAGTTSFVVSVTQTGHDNTTAQDVILTVDVVGGVVTAVTNVSNGTGYIDGTGFTITLATTAGGGDGAATLGYDVANGEVINVTVTNGGTGYVDGSGVAVTDAPVSVNNNPGHTANGIAVEYTSMMFGESLAEVVESTQAVIDAEADFIATFEGNVVTVTNANAGATTTPADIDSGVTVIQTTAGTTSVDPAPGGTGIEVAIESDDLATVVAEKTEAAIEAATSEVIVDNVGNTLTISNVAQGDVTDSTNGSTGFDIEKIQDGSNATLATYSLTVYNGATEDTVTVLGVPGATFDDLITSINLQLTDSTASIVDGSIVFTSDNVETDAVISVVDDNLLSSLDLTGHFLAVDDGNGTLYDVGVIVDGTLVTGQVLGADCATFADLVVALSAAIAGATFSIDANDNILVTSDTTGNASSIKVPMTIEGELPLIWRAVNHFHHPELPVHGGDTFADVVCLTRGEGGDLIINKFAYAFA